MVRLIKLKPGEVLPISGKGIYAVTKEGGIPQRVGEPFGEPQKDEKMQKLERGLRKAELYGKGLDVAQKYAIAGKTVGGAGLTALIALGGITAFIVLFKAMEWWMWVGIIFALVVILRRMK